MLSRPVTPLAAPRLSIRGALIAGFLLLFVLASGFAWNLDRRLETLKERAAAERARFAESEGLLLTVGAQVLLGTVHVRDALLEGDPAMSAAYLDEHERARERIEQALQSYLSGQASPAEAEQWARLRDELEHYWEAFVPTLAPGAERDPDQTRERLRDNVIPRRRNIIQISEQIRTLNRETSARRSAENTALYEGVRADLWRAGGLAVALGLVIAVAATRYAGSLEARLREQQRLEAAQMREVERLSAQLVRAQEEERRALSRELHDEVGQALTAVKLELSDADRRRRAGARGAHDNLENLDNLLDGARAITEGAIRAVRDVSQLLNPSLLDTLGLTAALDSHLARFSERTGLRTDFSPGNVDGRLDPAVEICAYRVVQEAVTNVVKHARATSCRVALERVDDQLIVHVDDDGRGMNIHKRQGAGLGLVGIRERAAALGGSFAVDSSPGEGTRLTVILPSGAPSDAADEDAAPAARAAHVAEVH